MNIYTGLLFQHGHIQDPQLALSLAGGEDRPAQAPSHRASQDRRPARKEKHASFRRGAIFAVCSTALSPFR
ncbi:hypothetical protein M2650_15725 [Luteimonas sp. SX5]|uniref:Uncharacterized protein n=1 Tax=Luteimonas galliterrae TaxID=2940486 RepID=A0ABT0MN70_9GAMM|nr:hypothetical protein [Luteimonas galliterrae]MCL1636073.1 hypothetical protein [Luteimonas galliterrae]